MRSLAFRTGSNWTAAAVKGDGTMKGSCGMDDGEKAGMGSGAGSDGHVAIDHRIGQVGDGAGDRDRALFQHGEAAGHAAGEADVLFHQHHGHAQLGIQAHDGGLDLLHDRGLDAFVGLVEQHHLRRGSQRPGDRQLLLLAARQHAAGAVEVRGQVGKQLQRQRRHLARPLAGEGAHQDVLPHGEIGNDLAALRHVGDAGTCTQMRGLRGDVGAIQQDGTRAVHQAANQGAQQRGLAHAIAPEHGRDLAGRHPQVDAVQRMAAPVVAVDVLQF